MASHTVTINTQFGGKVIKNVLKNVTAVLSLDPSQVDSPRLKLAVWMIRLGMWIGGLGQVGFEFEGEQNSLESWWQGWPDGKWHHIVQKYDEKSSVGKVYIDGIRQRMKNE